MKTASLIFTLLLTGGALVSCSSTSNENQVAQSDDDLICKMEKVLGSNIRQKVCKTRKQRREDQEGGERLLDAQ